MTARTTALRYVTCFAVAVAIGASAAQAQAIAVGDLKIENATSRVTPAGAKVGAGYMTISNTGTTADRLVSLSSPAADKVEIHEMAMKDGVMTMRELPGGLPVDSGKVVTLKPGGYHLMLMGLKAPLRQGDKVPVTLTFEKAGTTGITLDVQAIGTRQPAPGHSMQKTGH